MFDDHTMGSCCVFARSDASALKLLTQILLNLLFVLAQKVVGLAFVLVVNGPV
jgi:hypothetical protein